MTGLINPARVDFVTLRLFCAVAQLGSITKGAEACQLALSAASRRLSDFESAVGAVLLERSHKGITLTPTGHVAMQHALRLFQGFEQFSSELNEYSRGIRGHVRLWANMSALTEFLPAILASFMVQHPDIRVEIEEQLSGDIVRALFDGLADIGVFAESAPAHGLDIRQFQSDQLVVICARNHPIAAHTQISFKECLSYDFVGLNRGSSLLELMSRAAERVGLPLRLRVQVRSFDVMCRMIHANLGIGVLPLAVCIPQVSSMHLHVVPLTDKWANRRLLAATKADVPLAVATMLLREHLLSESQIVEGATLHGGTFGAAAPQ